jgi:CBS domain containing-hemolysin-like protein
MIALIVESGHSRYPVYRETIDHVEGILYAKDLFSLLRKPSDVSRISITELIRKPVCFVAETQKIGACLREMQERGVHLALVVDEFGGTAGVVTLEDILEEIVGEIRDEHDVDEVQVEEIGPGRYLADAGMSVYDLMDVLGEPITEQENNGEYDSLGGLVTALAGRVPRAGETVRVGGYDLLVREADERRVIRVEVMKRAITEMPPEPVPEEPAGATG